MPFLSASGMSPYNKIRGGALGPAAIPFTFGNALDFDGVNDYVSVTETNSLPDYTISSWFRADSFNTFFASSSNGFANIWMRFSTRFYVRDVSGGVTASFAFPALSVGTWNHFALVGTGGNARMYINGVESTSLSQSLGNMQFANLGKSSTSYFAGLIDETSIWTSALTAGQIADQYNSGNGNYADADVTPLLWWKLNESGTATTAVNSGSGGSTYDGTLNNFPTSGMWVDHYTGLPFAFNNTLQFDGVNDFVSFNSGINLTSAFTFSTWLKPSVFSLQALFANSSYSQGYIAIMNSTTLRFNSAGGGSSNFTVPTMVAGEWCHIAITRDASNNVKLYFNGVATQTYVNTGTAFIDSISNYNSGQFRTSVAIDEVGILTGTDATLTQIASLYNSGAGENFTSVMGSSDLNYHLDESGTATTAVDSSGNGNDGTLSNFTLPGAWVPHTPFAFGNALEFDGVNDYIQTTWTANLTGTIGLSFWVKSASGVSAVPFAKNGTEYIQTQPGLNRIVGYIDSVGVWTHTYTQTPDVWQHFLLTYIGTEARVYINGVESSTGARANTAGRTFSINRVGSYSISSGYSVMTVDELAATTNSSGLTEAVALYNSGNGSDANAVLGSTELYYHLNESGTATTAVDSSGSGNDGTLINFATSGMWVPHTPVLLLDFYPSAANAYSLRRINSTYTGSLIRVRRSSDNVEQDIGYDSANILDTTALTSFVGANEGYVVSWYDQSGNAANASQSTATRQPKIVTSGNVILESGKPTVWFDSLSSFSNGDVLNATLSGAQPISLFNLRRYRANGTNLAISFDGGSSGYADINLSSEFRIYNGTYLAYGASNLNRGLWYSLSNGAASSVALDSSVATSGNSGTNAATQLTIGAGGLNFFAPINEQEIIIYKSDQTINRSAIEANINSFYIDPDAQAFISAALITGTTQQNAMASLVSDLKGTSGNTTSGTDVWSKLRAFYPMCPIDATTFTLDACKWNLINPLDTDAAFRMTWVNSPTVTYEGVKGDGTSAYGNTHFVESAQMTAGNNGMTRDSFDIVNQYYQIIAGADYPKLSFRRSTVSYSGNVQLIHTAAPEICTISRLTATDFTVYKDGTSIATSATSTTTQANQPMFVLSSSNQYGNPIDPVALGLTAFAIHDGLTANEAQDISDAITNFNTALGR